MPLVLLIGFQSLPLLPTSKLHLSCANSQVGGFVYILGPCASLQWFSCETGSFSHHCTPHRILQLRFWVYISPPWNPGLCGLSHSPVVPPSLSTHKCGPPSLPAATLLHILSALASLSLSLLLVWMKVSSLTPWLSDFHTIGFSGRCGYFLFLNWLLSFFWLCEEAKNIYLCFHLGQKQQ